MNNTTGGDNLNTLPHQLKEEYIYAWVAQGTARAEWLRGNAELREVHRSQVKLMRVMLEVAKDCTDADHYAACKTDLDRKAYGLLRLEESYSFGSWLSSPTEAEHHWSY